MSGCTAHTVALCTVEFKLHLISRQQDELSTNFYDFLQDLMNSCCITDIIAKLKCQLLRMCNGCGCIKTKEIFKSFLKMIEF